jgi:hypothetical protein
MVFIRSYPALLTSSGILRMLSLIACSFVPYRTPEDVNRAKLSHPWYDTQRLLLADGYASAAIYIIQALWSAARYNVDAKFIVCNTCSYTLLQVNIQACWKERQIIEIMIILSR